MMVKWFAQYCDNDITNPQGLNKRIREAEQDDWDAILKLVKGWCRCQKGVMLADGTIVTEAEQERRANEFQDHAAINASMEDAAALAAKKNDLGELQQKLQEKDKREFGLRSEIKMLTMQLNAEKQARANDKAALEKQIEYHKDQVKQAQSMLFQALSGGKKN